MRARARRLLLNGRVPRLFALAARSCTVRSAVSVIQLDRAQVVRRVRTGFD